MNDEKTYSGSCFCGAVQLTVSGEPEGMGYCHCASHAGAGRRDRSMPSLYGNPKQNDHPGSGEHRHHNKTPNSYRKWCKTCGGHVLTEHPGLGLTDVYAAVIPYFPYHAGVHVHYQETVLPMKDGLPKMKDLPEEMGGSGYICWRNDTSRSLGINAAHNAWLPRWRTELSSVRRLFCFARARAARGRFSSRLDCRFGVAGFDRSLWA